MATISKQLVLISTTFASITEISKKDEIVLKRILYIYYPLRIYKNKKNEVQALINLGSKINTMILAYASKLDLKIRHTKVKAQKINGSTFQMFGMVLASFKVEDKQDRAQYFQ